jgi:hypothetical protein
MSYDAPLRITYSRNAINFATNSSRILRGPKGKRGRVVDIQVSGTTLFTNVTTSGRVQVGVAGSAATLKANADLDLGALAAGAAINASNQNNALVGQPGSAIPYLAADTDFTLGFIGPTGGTPAGVGDVDLTIDWF